MALRRAHWALLQKYVQVYFFLGAAFFAGFLAGALDAFLATGFLGLADFLADFLGFSAFFVAFLLGLGFVVFFFLGLPGVLTFLDFTAFFFLALSSQL